VNEEWKSVKVLAGTIIGATLCSYFVFVCIKNPEQAGAITSGISTAIVSGAIYDLIKGS